MQKEKDFKVNKKNQKYLDSVKKSYNTIAQEFSDTRIYPWKEFDLFKKYLSAGQTIIDLGCGNGRLLNFLYKHFYNNDFNYLGIDNSENLLKKAKQAHSEAAFILGDQIQIPTKNEFSDIIFNIAAFHHIPSKKLRLKALKEMHRVLKKDGMVIITVWMLWQKKYLKQILQSALKSIITLGKHNFKDLHIPFKNSSGKKLTNRYYHAFTPSEINKLVKKCNFEIIENYSVKKGGKTNFLNSFNYCLVIKKK